MFCWVDTDGGVDDAVALIWAFHQEINIVGISTVAGNLPVNLTVNNIKALTEHYNSKIPVYKGAHTSFLGASINASHIHGTNLGPIVLDKNYQNDGHIFNGLLKFFETQNEKITIITIGPLTNIASFLIHFPEYSSRIERIIVMGGGTYGNIAPYGEFNIYVDPEAAHVIFSQNIPIILSDLNITDHHAYLTSEELEEFNKREILDEWGLELLRFRILKSHVPKAARVYDVLPFMYVLFPEKFSYDLIPIEIQLEGKMRGFTAYDYASNRENNFLFPEKNVNKILRLKEIKRDEYINLLLNGLTCKSMNRSK